MAAEDSRTTPLLQSHPSPLPPACQDESVPLLSPYEPHEATAGQNRRLVSLDVFRGLTIALMILVDDAGGAFPTLNHSPWFGVTIADFVMPFFLFIVGVSIGLVFKKVPNKSIATRKVIFRAIRLFIVGIFLQGGFFHGRQNLTYGVDLEKIRWLGVLQRIAIGYLLASLSEIYLVNNIVVDTVLDFVRRYYIQWLGVLLLCTVYISLLYGIHVPDWQYMFPSESSSFASASFETVQCGLKGSLEPPCNAVGFIDRIILGENHLYQHPVYRRTKDCSINSPDYGPLPPNAPGWCLAPFDPEGILRIKENGSLNFVYLLLMVGCGILLRGISLGLLEASPSLLGSYFERDYTGSLMAAVTCLVGLHYGHVIVHFKGHMRRTLWWCFTSLPLLVSGLLLHVMGMPLSKPLYTLSYMCVTAGASGFVFTIMYYLVDVQLIQKPTILFQWMGMNALVIYALAACDIFAVILQGFYWRSPENNLVDGTESLVRRVVHSERWGTLTFVMLKIVFWGLVAGYLHKKGRYVKL